MLSQVFYSNWAKLIVPLMFLTSLGFVFEANAYQYGRLTVHELTEKTDLWVHAKIKRVKSISSRENRHGGGRWHTASVTFDVLNSTNQATPSQIVVQFETDSFHRLKVDDQYYIALIKKGKKYSTFGLPYWQLRVKDGKYKEWNHLVAGEQLWKLLVDTRRAVNTNGIVPNEVAEKWTQALVSDDFNIAILAKEFLENTELVEFDYLRLAHAVIGNIDSFSAKPNLHTQANRSTVILGRDYLASMAEFVLDSRHYDSCQLLANHLYQNGKMRMALQTSENERGARIESLISTLKLVTPRSDDLETLTNEDVTPP